MPSTRRSSQPDEGVVGARRPSVTHTTWALHHPRGRGLLGVGMGVGCWAWAWAWAWAAGRGRGLLGVGCWAWACAWAAGRGRGPLRSWAVPGVSCWAARLVPGSPPETSPRTCDATVSERWRPYGSHRACTPLAVTLQLFLRTCDVNVSGRWRHTDPGRGLLGRCAVVSLTLCL